MLLALRETVKNSKPIKYTLITIICIPFALFGVSSYFSGGGYAKVATVGGEEIGFPEFEQAYNQQRNRLQQMFGGRIPEGFANDASLRQQALDSLISQQVLRNTVADSQFAVSDKTLATAITSIPAFQVEGRFDQEIYERQLQSMGMSVAQFESSYRDDTALAQFRSGLVDTSFSLPTEKALIQELSNQERTADFVRFSMSERKDNIEVSDEEINAWFDENKDNYKFPERVKIAYLELSNDKLAEQIDISDEEALEYYEGNKSSYVAPEERKASHILLEVDDDADLDAKTQELNDIKARIEAGEDFGELAKSYSSDVGSAANNGSLGQFGRGAMVPEFETAVYAMTEAGELSEPVKSDFGLHLIRLDEIVAQKSKPFEDIQADVVNDLKRQQAESEFLDLSELLTETSLRQSRVARSCSRSNRTSGCEY